MDGSALCQEMILFSFPSLSMNSTHGYGLDLAQVHTEANQKSLCAQVSDKFPLYQKTLK